MSSPAPCRLRRSGVGPAPRQPPLERATWQTIQDEILGPRCTTCHVAGSSFATQSDLILTPDVAYAQLVDVRPHNAAARGDSLWRLGRNGLSSLYESYLWEKIDAPNQAHFYTDHQQFGSLMPLGEPPLTNGELEYLRRWILAGAPETGIVAETSLLADSTRWSPPAFVPLPAPVRGLQLHLGPFEVQPGRERELFSYARSITWRTCSSNGRDHDAAGQHHFIMYEYRDGTPRTLMPQANRYATALASGPYDLQVLLRCSTRFSSPARSGRLCSTASRRRRLRLGAGKAWISTPTM